MSAGDTSAIEKCLVLPPLGIRRSNGHYLQAYSSGGHLDSTLKYIHTSYITVKRVPPPKLIVEYILIYVAVNLNYIKLVVLLFHYSHKSFGSPLQFLS